MRLMDSRGSFIASNIDISPLAIALFTAARSCLEDFAFSSAARRSSTESCGGGTLLNGEILLSQELVRA